MLKIKHLCYSRFPMPYDQWEFYWDAPNPLFVVNGGTIQLLHWSLAKWKDTGSRKYARGVEISNIVMGNTDIACPIIPILCS